MQDIFKEILPAFSLSVDEYAIAPIGNGHINHTYKVSGPRNAYVLQRINNKVFTRPEIIESNLTYVASFLSQHEPSYKFIAPLQSASGRGLVFDHEGHPWRLYPFIPGTHTIEEATNASQAREAAAAFGRFARLLIKADVSKVNPTIERFHDLGLRYQQFEIALSNASEERLASAASIIDDAKRFSVLKARYQEVISKKILTPGIYHNDTKINNVLFDEHERAVAVIDLDTVMAGYFIYDLGDLLRTLVSPVSEEEKEIDKIELRVPVYDAVVNGYMSEMEQVLSKSEQQLATFAGPMMTYIMGLRFLADYLRGDTYYHITYKEQNLVRARNQFQLLGLFGRKRSW